MAGGFQQKSKGRVSLIFAGANHTCSSARLTPGLTLLRGWNITADTTANSERGRRSLMRSERYWQINFIVESNARFERGQNARKSTPDEPPAPSRFFNSNRVAPQGKELARRL